MKTTLITTAILSTLSILAFSPASAAMMSCTSDNMMKSQSMMQPGMNGANKEMAMANTDMSNGKMRSACMHYMKAQKMSMMEPQMGMGMDMGKMDMGKK